MGVFPHAGATTQVAEGRWSVWIPCCVEFVLREKCRGRAFYQGLPLPHENSPKKREKRKIRGKRNNGRPGAE